MEESTARWFIYGSTRIGNRSGDIHRHGLGSEIIHFCIDKAKSQGYKAIRLDVVPNNYPARILFEKNGFTYAGDVDLELKIGNIPYFSLYELNW